MTKDEALKLALEALEESVDLVRHEYNTDWRHGLPSRKAKLEGMKAGLDAHEAAITALREALAQPKKRNFCPRCGKRLASGFVEISIHTCTPPHDKTR